MIRSALFLLLFLLFQGCGSHPPLPTVKKVEPDRYLGLWYEIGRYPNRFEEGCTAVTAEYGREGEKISVTNRCRLFNPGGKEKVARGTAYPVKGSANAKLRVTFFWPFYGDYQVLMLAPDYRYAVVGEPSREYLWILSRTPGLDREDRESILARLPGLGYPVEPIHWTVHP